MKQEEELIEKYGRESGMRVPEGYFASLQEQVMGRLSAAEQQKPMKPASLSAWQRVKPYVYLAAMFCGIWLMMKVFHTATRPMSLSLDNPPEALVELLDTGYDYDLPYVPYYDFDASEEELIMSYDNIEDFENDFYASK